MSHFALYYLACGNMRLVKGFGRKGRAVGVTSGADQRDPARLLLQARPSPILQAKRK